MKFTDTTRAWAIGAASVLAALAELPSQRPSAHGLRQRKARVTASHARGAEYSGIGCSGGGAKCRHDTGWSDSPCSPPKRRGRPPSTSRRSTAAGAPIGTLAVRSVAPRPSGLEGGYEAEYLVEPEHIKEGLEV